ncbi:ATP-dependent DNA helicase RecG [Patulibacter brassicae]|uniref:ATP-dependent DNA helicase RecG n=1 Tax=Patulibacter brassicae TaxID=1705717 RepID=A0ABU4VFI1_9ACTN|nr:ATP-dependent DNA helicase RecG [Patulibacter brassicae]MDX8150464.1 ATP-dependent DNA helicase RecG [Patulibacter brassicae]
MPVSGSTTSDPPVEATLPPFAGDPELPAGREALRAAPLRWPRPAALGADSGFTGKKATKAAAALGIDSIGGLLHHLPVEGGEVATIDRLRPDERLTIVVEVRRIQSRPVRRRGMRPLVTAWVSDHTGQLEAAFFNQPWLVERYPPGTRLILSGTLKGPGRFSVAQHAPTTDEATPRAAPPGRPAASAPLADAMADAGADLHGRGDGDGGAAAAPVQHASDAVHPPVEDLAGEETRLDGPAAPTIARYPTTEGLTSIEILARVRELQDHLRDVVEPLPGRLRVRYDLPDRVDALHAGHLGDHEAGRRRLAFDELLLTQLEYLRRRRRQGVDRRAPALDGPTDLSDRWLASLPFPPTGDQAKAIAANTEALAQPHPLQRLLMGEVGSGKTVVALHAMVRAVECGHQAALMAPTETLAEQHFRTVQALLGDLQVVIPVALLTGSTPQAQRRELLARLASGELPLIVGTHALLEDPVVFRSLALAVVDEQHRFGVRQRRALDAKASGVGAGTGASAAAWAPHVLHMTATPIPRTMALLHYGDLDVVTLRELPKGRSPIATHVCASDRERARAYARIREEVAAGRQAFVVCPLVADSESLDARSAVAEHERLQAGELKDLRLALLHGQMKPAEKQAAMASFAAGDADVLVATTVIEVGIDVPNATVMLIENAERFGISQLHQLRGRVGRGEHPAICLLFGPKGAARLRALAAHGDGFALSEVDLELRGEGEVLGTRQSGLARFRTARLPDDADLLQRARTLAEELEAKDPELQDPRHALLAAELDRVRRAMVAEGDDESIAA